jgi:hypothetical protein
MYLVSSAVLFMVPLFSYALNPSAFQTDASTKLA